MSRTTLPGVPFSLFAPPYRRLLPLEDVTRELASLAEWRGAALVWRMSSPIDGLEVEAAQGRPPGISLVTILPPSDRIARPDGVLGMVELCRPLHVLPHHERPDPFDLRSVLSRPPEDLASEVTDYLGWRGIAVDIETRRLIRRTVELTADLRTVQGLARSLYLSRRALGRRFVSRGLPVPSHWLQIARLLRAAIRLQNSEETLLVAASSLGYPDGFALSNQMKRLTGLRPSAARRFLGWEWLLESWLRMEARNGGLTRDFARLFGTTPAPVPVPTPTSAETTRPTGSPHAGAPKGRRERPRARRASNSDSRPLAAPPGP